MSSVATAVGGQIGGVGLKEDAITDIDDEVLSAAGGCGATGAEAIGVGILIVGAGAECERGRDGSGEAKRGAAAGKEGGEHDELRAFELGEARVADEDGGPKIEMHLRHQ